MISLVARQLQRLYPRLLDTIPASQSVLTVPMAVDGLPMVTSIATRRFSLRPLSVSSSSSTPFAFSSRISNGAFSQTPRRWFATDVQTDETLEAEHHELTPKEIEPEVTTTKTHEFQAETRKLLDIVARSLYSEREVFVRELISNASDALEKLHRRKVLGEAVDDLNHPEEIRIITDELENTLTIQDYGIGMTEAELIKNLGTIAHSGTGEFVKKLGSDASTTDLIGQFGVGFYSAFMVADKVTVFSKSAVPGSPGIRWVSDGTGSYEIGHCKSGVDQGTKIVLHLKSGASEFSKASTIQDVIKRYSSFVRFNIKLNGTVANSLQAIWTKPKSEVTDAQHQEFYQFISRSYDKPMYHLHFTTDTPLSIQSIFYIPGQHSEKYGMGRMDPGVSLYSRRVMIQAAAKGLLPDWLRFIKGVVDSDDIPLNLSRELLQDSAIIQRLNTVLTRRILKFLSECALSDPEQYDKFFAEFGQFLKEGSCTDAKWKEELGKLMRFESSALPPRKFCSFDDYISRMKSDQEDIYYLVVPSRNFAESSPYYEGFQQRGIEVLFLYTSLDDFMMGNLQTYSGKRLVTIESAEPAKAEQSEEKKDTPAASSEFGSWLQDVLDERVSAVKASTRLVSSPAVIVDHESASFRRMMSFVDPNRSPKLPKQILEYNPTHPIILQLEETRKVNSKLASLVAEQIFDDALISAGLMEDARVMIPRLNSLLEAALTASNKSTAAENERVDAE